MNFLDLVQATRRECGISGAGPAAVTGQTGMSAKIVAWVNEAYMEILGRHDTWRFMWGKQLFDLQAGKNTYAPATDFGVKVKTWMARDMSLYRVSAGPNGLFFPYYMTWPDFSAYSRLPSNPGLPEYWSERPDKSIAFYPTPDQAMKLDAEFYLDSSPLVANTDVPRIPLEYHMIIVWRAVMLYAGSDEAPSTFQWAAQNYATLMAGLEGNQLEPMLIAEPLVS